MSLEFKFSFILICFFISLGSYFFSYSKRDWAWLTIGLGFTVGADYFLVLHDAHAVGVAVFCFAHVCYIIRATEGRLRLWFVGLIFLAAAIVVALTSRWIFAVVGLYAGLFIFNIVLSFYLYKSKKASLPKRNRALVVTGLILFALCDINVVIMNLPRYFNAPDMFLNVYPLIWIFYLPSQMLLSISSVDFDKYRRIKKRLNML